MWKWRVWVPLVCVGAAALIGYLTSGEAEVRIRYFGLGFELAGIVTVAVGLEERRKLFGHPRFLQGVWDIVKHWLSIWRRPQKRVLEIRTGDTVMVGLTGKLSVWRGVPSDAPLPERVTALEANLTTLKDEQGDISKRLQEEEKKRDEAVTSERRAREESDQHLNKKLQELGAGNLHLELLGVIWLVIGLILTTTSSEIASAFGPVVGITKSQSKTELRQTHSNGGTMFDIRSLEAEIQSLSALITTWNKVVIWGMAFTAFAAIVLFVAQFKVNKESKHLSDAQDRLIKAKDENLARDLREKDVLITSANERASQANERAEQLEVDAAKLRERAAQAEKDLLELQERFKARHITVEQQTRILEALSRSAKGKITVSCASGQNPEPCVFAKEIENIVRLAGWHVHLSHSLYAGRIPVGLILQAGDRALPTADALQEAFETAGIKMHRQKASGIGDDRISLTVGSKT